MKKLIILCLFAVGCTNTVDQIKLNDGKNGNDGYSSVLKTEPAGSSCVAGGTRLFFGLDVNRNGVYDTGDTPQSDFSVCNGVPGAPGVSPSVVAVQPGPVCTSGGVTISVGNATEVVCNGTNGAVGPAGPQGVPGQNASPLTVTTTLVTGGTLVQFMNNGSVISSFTVFNGADGQSVSMTPFSGVDGACTNGGVKLTSGTVTNVLCNGTNGTNGKTAYELAQAGGYSGTEAQWLLSLKGPVGPMGPAGSGSGSASSRIVQLCPGDSASYKEYGIISDGKLYAVYNDRSNGFSFLGQLVSGAQYQTTNVANQSSACRFTYTNDGSVVELTNSGTGETQTYPLVGSCTLKKTQDNPGSQHYRFTLNNLAGVLGDFSIELHTSGTTTSVGTSNNGNMSKNGSTSFSFDPINNSQNSFEIYVNSPSNGQVQVENSGLSIKKKSTNEVTQCTVDNSL